VLTTRAKPVESGGRGRVWTGLAKISALLDIEAGRFSCVPGTDDDDDTISGYPK
jgi:hypothetical protein